MPKIKRCNWATSSDLETKYHDEEWGVALHDDQKIFEMLILEMFQAGLSWKTILAKRENFRKAFDNFDYKQIVLFDQEKIEELMQNSGIIRNRKKIESTVTNAQEFMKVQKEYGSFDHYIWHFTDFKTIDHKINQNNLAPAKDDLSIKIAANLKKMGFKFLGPVIIYSFIQSIGIINDHELNCDFHDTNQSSA